MAQATPRRITVIDDHSEFLGLMRELLSASYEVRTFTGREISPDDILESRPDLLIVDLRLDRRDLQGWDVVTLVRAHRHLRRVPIIVCSADTGALADRSEAMLRAGNIAALAKPFNIAELDETVRLGLAGGFADPLAPARDVVSPLPDATPAQA